MALNIHAAARDLKPSSTTSGAYAVDGSGELDAPSWTMELSRWRVRLRRLKRWSRYEGRASDGQFDTHDVPDSERLRSPSEQPERQRHSFTSVGTVAAPNCHYRQYQHVVPPVCIPIVYRQQDKQRGVRVAGERVPFTLDGHKRRRKMVRPLARIDEAQPLNAPLPDMRNSMAMMMYRYARRGLVRSRRACSV